MLSKQKAALVFVFITVLLDMLALGIIVPVLPKLIFGPGLFSGVFAYSVSSRHVWKLPSAAWFLGAILLGTAALVAWIVTASSDELPRAIDLSASLKDVRPADEPSGG